MGFSFGAHLSTRIQLAPSKLSRQHVSNVHLMSLIFMHWTVRQFRCVIISPSYILTVGCGSSRGPLCENRWDHRSRQPADWQNCRIGNSLSVARNSSCKFPSSMVFLEREGLWQTAFVHFNDDTIPVIGLPGSYLFVCQNLSSKKSASSSIK